MSTASKKAEIRLIKESDCSQALEVYAPYVRETAITFDTEVPAEAEFLKKIRTITSEYPWLVYVENEKVMGYAYGSRHRPKAAYGWSPECTIYMAPGAQGKGIGKLLYQTLFDILKLQGFYNIFAGVTIPNEKSEKIHKSVGLQEIGIFKNIGYKLGKWHDTKWFGMTFNTNSGQPVPPLNINEVINTEAFSNIIQGANENLKKINSI